MSAVNRSVVNGSTRNRVNREAGMRGANGVVRGQALKEQPNNAEPVNVNGMSGAGIMTAATSRGANVTKSGRRVRVQPACVRCEQRQAVRSEREMYAAQT